MRFHISTQLYFYTQVITFIFGDVEISIRNEPHQKELVDSQMKLDSDHLVAKEKFLGTIFIGQGNLTAKIYHEKCSESVHILKENHICNIYAKCGHEGLDMYMHHCMNVTKCGNNSNCQLIEDMSSILNYFRSYGFQLLTRTIENVDFAMAKKDLKGMMKKSQEFLALKVAPLFSKRTHSQNRKIGNLTVNKFHCFNMSQGNFSYKDSCTIEYIQCVQGIPYIRSCGNGLVFNSALMACDEMKNVPRCHSPHNNYDVSELSSQNSVETKHFVIKREIFGKAEMNKPCTQSDYYIQPHSEHCNKFQICSNGKIKVETCGSGALFNPLSLVCDFPSNVDCQSRKIDFSTYDCQNEDKYTTSHPEDCNKFIECDKGALAIKTCPPSTTFNYENSECDHIYKVKCKKPISLEHDSHVNHIRRSRSIPQQNPLNLDCSFNYIAPHPNSCSKFVECENGRIFIKNCGPGTAYDPRLGQCNWPFNVRQPHPEDCKKFLQCERGRYVEKLCGGNSIFDRQENKCVPSLVNDYDLECRGRQVITPPPS